MTTGLLITTAGQAAITADLSGGADLVLTHVAFGDASGVPYNPNEAQTALVNERYRSPIASVAVIAGAIVVDAVIPADTPDGSARPSHGFNVAECGLFSAAGTLIGVARMGNGYKPPPSSGQASIATFRIKLAVANPSAITVVIDPVAQLALGRHVRVPWLTIDGVLNAPPGAPTQGSTYIVGAAPTGAWAGFAHRIAQWVGVWSLSTAPTGHVVCDNSRAEDHDSRFLKRTGAGWASAAATDTAFGLTRMATAAEAAAKVSATTALSPLTAAAATSIVGRTQIFFASGAFVVPAGVTSVEVEGVGGGGAGGASNAGAGGGILGNGGGGGHAGGYFYKRVTGLVPGATVAVTVGAGGLGQAASFGTAGGSSSFGAHASATGGGRGIYGGNTYGILDSPGAGAGGDINMSGGFGGPSGPNSSTYDPSFLFNVTGRGGLAPRGFGTVGFFGSGGAGIGFGAGGTGSTGGSGLAGGAGAPGIVIVRW